MFTLSSNLHKKKCSLCSREASDISDVLGVCKKCLLDKSEEALTIISGLHSTFRRRYQLPITPPKNNRGLVCGDCVNNCQIGIGETGYCGLVKNVEGKLQRIAGDNIIGGKFSFYYDPLPTNCVAAPFCPGCSSVGYPAFSYSKGPEIGWNNLAVFYQACTFDCLFCQNYQYRKELHTSPPRKAEVLISAIRENTSCICFFGGDPAAQIRHSNTVGKLALEKAKEEERIIRVCWETNGSERPSLLRTSTQIALETGGSVKIDCKAFDDTLNRALCGSSNKFTLHNIKEIGKRIIEREENPLLVVSTLLIPGYIEKDQVEKIAGFIANINPTIPYSLLAFYPTFVLNDLPTTSLKQAEECLQAAKKEGLENVEVGNKHLLR